MKKRISIVSLTVLLLLNMLGVINVNADLLDVVTQLTPVSLKYFDEAVWTQKGTDAYLTPNGIKSFNGTAANSNSQTRVTGAFGKASDDSAFRIQTIPTVAATQDISVSLLDVGTTYRYELKAGVNQVIMVSLDVATSTVTTSTQKNIMGGRVYSVSSGGTSTTRKYPAHIQMLSNSTILGQPYVTEKWYNVIFVIGSEPSGLTTRTYIDGNLVNTGTIYSVSSFIYLDLLRAYIQSAAGKVDDLYLDNIAIYKGEEFSPARYFANRDAAKLSFANDMLNGNTSSSEVRTNINMPTTIGSDGTTVTWQSSNPAVISTSGAVTRDIADTNVKLTATITNGTISNTKEFDVVVKQADVLPDTVNDAAALTYATILNANTNETNISTNLSLPTTGASGNTTITWSSSDSNAISTTGVVAMKANPQTVTLTATIEKTDDVTQTKQFAFTVLPNYSLVDKSKLSALVDANASKNPSDYVAASYSVFETAYTNASSGVEDPYLTQAEVDALLNTLNAAVNNLTFNVIETNGTVTKDAYTYKTTPTTVTNTADLVSKYFVTETSQASARRAFIGFNIENIDVNASKVLLKLYITGLGSNISYADTIDIYSSGNTWTESTLTWNNMPLNYSATPLASMGPLNINSGNANYSTVSKYYEFDVTSYVMSQKRLATPPTELSFAISGSNSGSSMVIVSSKENTNGNIPLLLAQTNVTIGSKIDADLNAIDMNNIINDISTSLITKDLKTLPTSGSVNGYAISWSSSNPAVISDTGVVAVPQEDTPVTLTATITSDGVTHSRTFDLTVVVMDDDETDFNALSFDSIKANNVSETDVTSKLTLISNGTIKNTPISWTSSDESIISNNGDVTRTALINAQDVTLTATIGSYQKIFYLRVSGDDYLLDKCVDKTKAFYSTADLAISTESTWRISGFAHSANGKTGQYIIYNATEGANFSVKTTVNTQLGTNRVTFATSSDNITYVPFTSVNETNATLAFGEYGGYSLKTYNNVIPLPAGTRYLKVIIPDTTSAWHNYVNEVKIFKSNAEIKFADIKGSNYSSDIITTNLNLPTTFNDSAIEWSSSSPIIAIDGTYAAERPSIDTAVTLTAKITKDSIISYKKYHLIAKAYADKLTVSDRPFAWYKPTTRYIAVKADAVFGESDTLHASVNVSNLTNGTKDITIAIVVYEDVTNNILDVCFEKVSVDNQTTAPQEKALSFKLNQSGTHTSASYVNSRIKSFVWADTSMAPLFTELNVKRVK